MLALLLVTLTVVAVVVPSSDEPASALLGRLDQAAGVSSTGPPPVGLRVAWEVPRRIAAERCCGGLDGPVAAAAGRLRIGDRVVDTTTGRVVRATRSGWEVVVEGGTVVALDPVTGAVRSRTPLPPAWAGLELEGARRASAVTLLSSWTRSLLLHDDGSVVAELDGRVRDHIDRVAQDPAAFPVRRGAGGSIEGDHRLPLVLVRADTGEVLLDLPGNRSRRVDVVGELALVAATDETVFSGARVLQPSRWSLLLLDASVGVRLHQWEVTARSAPRLLGRLTDGAAVIAVETRDEVEVVAVRPGRHVRTVTTARRPPSWATLDAATVVDDVVVLVDDGQLVGRAADGQVLWQVPATGGGSLRGAGGHVVVSRGTVVVVRRVTDGAVVATLSPQGGLDSDRAWLTQARAVIDGRLVVDKPSWTSVGMLLAMDWIDLETGRVDDWRAVLAPYLPSGEQAQWHWRLHGTEAVADGATTPVVTRADRPAVLGRGTVELLEPGVGFSTYALPTVRSAVEDEAGPIGVGAVAGRLVLTTDRPSMIHVVDRTADTVTTVEGLRGLVLAGTVVVALEQDEPYRCVWCGAALVGMDVATGERGWSVPVPRTRGIVGDVWSRGLVADDELVVLRALASITARNVVDGTERWTHASPVELFDQIVLGPERVAVATTDGQVVALDRSDGTVAWRTQLSAPVASLTGAGDHVLAGLLDGVVVHLDDRGDEVQRIRVGTLPVHVAVALGETVVAASDDGWVGLRADASGPAPHDAVELP